MYGKRSYIYPIHGCYGVWYIHLHWGSIMTVEFRCFPSVLSVCLRWKLFFEKCTGFTPRKVVEASRKGSLRGRLRKEDLTLYIFLKGI